MKPKENLIKKLAFLLAKYPETRDDDQGLMVQFYRTYYPHEIDDQDKIYLVALAKMTNPDDIFRKRADIQNKLFMFLCKKAENRIKRGHNDKYEAWVNLAKNPTALQEALKKHKLA